MQIVIDIPNKEIRDRVMPLIKTLKDSGVKIVTLRDNKSNSIQQLKKFKGMGKELYKNINSDDYIKKLRDEW